MGFIYKITNTINGKAYVGQTYRTVQERFVEHIRTAKKENVGYKSLLYEAIKKYGEGAFVVDILEECSDELLNDREAYWIKNLNTYRKGYNISLVTQKGSKYRISDIATLWNKGYSATEIANEIGISKQIILDRLHDCGVTSKAIMSRGNFKGNTQRRKVACLSQDGTIKIYNSIIEASKETGISTGAICETCKGFKNGIDGYYWVYYTGEDSLKDIKFPSNYKPQKKEIHQYSLDGHYIRSFESITEASRNVGGKGVRTLIVACENPNRTGYGYRWSFEKHNILTIEKRRRRKC